MSRRSLFRVLTLVAAIAACGLTGCSKPDANQEVVASANGESVKVVDVRDSLGMRGGALALPEIPVEKKREALDRLITIRLLAQEARRRGLDNTDDFRSVIGKNSRGVLINALFRREVSTRLKVSGDDVKSQAKKLRAADNTLSEEIANTQARRVVAQEKLRKIEEDLIAAARKEIPVSVNEELVGRIGKGEKVPDDAVLGTAANEKITYGDAKTLVNAMAGGANRAQDLFRNPVAMTRLVDREVTGMALAAYAKKQGLEGSEWAKAAREDVERSVLINLLLEKEITKDVSVSDKEIADMYAEHAQTFVRNGKKVPLSAAKPQIRDYLMNEKRRKAIESYVADLKKKAKITVKEDVLSKV